MAPEAQNRDKTIPPGQYLYIKDGTKGTIRIHNGPIIYTPTNNDVPVVFNGLSFVDRPLDEAIKDATVIPQGYYGILYNPVYKNDNLAAPEQGSKTELLAEKMVVGEKIVVVGPATFSLWPGQKIERHRGHQLRLNEYLVIKVYDEKAAKTNWLSAEIKPADPIKPSTDPSNETVREISLFRGSPQGSRDGETLLRPA